MTAALDRKDVTHLLDVLSKEPQVRLAETRIIEHLVKTGGETVIMPEKMKREAVAVLRIMESKGLIAAVIASSDLEIAQRTRIRLTDHGRKVAEYLEQMKANKVQQAESLSLEQLESIAGGQP